MEAVTAVSLDEVQSLIKDARVKKADGEAPPTGLQLGLMMAPFRKAARELAALETVTPAAPPPPAAVPTAPPAEDHTHLKFSDVLRQGTPGTFKPLSHAELSAARKNHRDILGRDPPSGRPPQ